jgi:hypothetical protein
MEVSTKENTVFTDIKTEENLQDGMYERGKAP